MARRAGPTSRRPDCRNSPASASSTHRRTMYTLDDIAPIRELGPTLAHGPLQVMKPRVATRGVDEAVIQYALARQTDSVRIEILDATGKVVRSFNGGGSAPPDTASG